MHDKFMKHLRGRISSLTANYISWYSKRARWVKQNNYKKHKTWKAATFNFICFLLWRKAVTPDSNYLIEYLMFPFDVSYFRCASLFMASKERNTFCPNRTLLDHEWLDGVRWTGQPNYMSPTFDNQTIPYLWY